jgi:hypothetical protein
MPIDTQQLSASACQESYPIGCIRSSVASAASAEGRRGSLSLSAAHSSQPCHSSPGPAGGADGDACSDERIGPFRTHGLRFIPETWVTLPYHTPPGAALPAEGDLDPQGPQEWLGATQPAGERPRVSRPAVPAVWGAIENGARTREVRRSPRPGGAPSHELADASCHRITIEDASRAARRFS